MHASRICVASALALLAACGAGEHAQPGAPAVPRQLAGGPVALPPQGAAAPFITFAGNASQYAVAASGGGYTITDIVSGAAQQVAAGSRLRFADTAVALDLGGNAGQAYRLYQAAFKRKPDLAGLGYHLATLDNGAALNDVAASFVTSGEFLTLYGMPDNTGFVALLYANVLGRAPDPAGLAYHVGNLDGTRLPGVQLRRDEVLAQFSESPENIALVLPDIRNGIEFLPWGSSLPASPMAAYAGQYALAVRGDDQGSIAVSIGADGAMALSGTLVNQSASGSGALQPGGRFSVALATTAGQSVTLAGSLNLASGVLAGSWVNTVTGQRGVFSWTRPAAPQLFPQVQAIITQRCVPCHSVKPTFPGFSPAPLGIRFDSEAEIRARSTQIFTSTVQSAFMPWANATNMTQAERDTLAVWFAAGTP